MEYLEYWEKIPPTLNLTNSEKLKEAKKNFLREIDIEEYFCQKLCCQKQWLNSLATKAIGHIVRYSNFHF